MTISVTKKDEVYLKVKTDLSTDQELNDFFTFDVPGAKFMPLYRNRMWDGKARLYSLYKKELYVGLLPYLKEFAETLEYDLDINIPEIGEETDVKKLTEALKLHAGGKPIQAREYQQDAVDHCIKQGRTLLLSPTASGKSLIIYSLIRYHQAKGRKQLIIVPTTSLVEQMYGDFQDYATADKHWAAPDNCHRIYGGKEKSNEYPVTISTWQSIYKFPKKWFEQFDVVYGDEAHLFKAKSLTTLMNKLTNTPYRIGTTGTLDGTKTHRLVLEGVFGQVHKVTTTKKLMEDKKVADLDITCLLLKYDELTRQGRKTNKYADEMDFLVTNDARNKFIVNLAADLKGNTLVLYQFVQKHGIPLYENLNNKVDGSKDIWFVSGDTVVKDREKVREIAGDTDNNIIVASFGTFSTGINIPSIENIIFASPSKSKIRNLQSIGRGLRLKEGKESCSLYDVADDLSWKSWKNHTLKHFSERLSIYSEEKFNYKIVEVNING